MARERRGERKIAKRRGKETPRRSGGRKGVAVQAVKTTQGPPATTVHVDVDPERLPGAKALREVEEVVAELPRADEAGGGVRWLSHRLSRASEEERAGRRTLRYVATCYEGCDAVEYGIRIHVRTKAGEVHAEGRAVREADKPDR
jgi:hypothetical protein